MRRDETGSTRALPTWLFVAAGLLLAGRVALGLNERRHPPVHQSPIEWKTPEEAEALSRQRGLPILYEFSAEWCGPCKELQRDVLDRPSIAQDINRRYIPVHVLDRMQEEGQNPPTVQALMQRYHIRAFPTMVVPSEASKSPRYFQGYPGRSPALGFLGIEAQ